MVARPITGVDNLARRPYHVRPRPRLPNRRRLRQTEMQSLGQRSCQPEKTEHPHRQCRFPHNQPHLPLQVMVQHSLVFGEGWLQRPMVGCEQHHNLATEDKGY